MGRLIMKNTLSDKDKLTLLEKFIQDNMYLDCYRGELFCVKCSYQEDSSLIESNNLSNSEAMYIITLLDEKLNKKLNEIFSKIQLSLTCGACPEQYDAFLDGKQVGYLRLRHGWFRVDFPDCGGETIYESGDMRGDGCFDEDEREYFLNEAKLAIAKRIIECGEY